MEIIYAVSLASATFLYVASGYLREFRRLNDIIERAERNLNLDHFR